MSQTLMVAILALNEKIILYYFLIPPRWKYEFPMYLQVCPRIVGLQMIPFHLPTISLNKEHMLYVMYNNVPKDHNNTAYNGCFIKPIVTGFIQKLRHRMLLNL
ncbi:hypothetical protein CHS0354_014490 [Potamilus streckersoni]|uniref:Uncharacterized protein n=1 Tax=Potamilus streckersoni TaxID=2493646 RepID=A0AAE0SA63_9BIVA|nr:hypothetical protein CHS0354_014490 [Potamilus streckersoni]